MAREGLEWSGDGVGPGGDVDVFLQEDGSGEDEEFSGIIGWIDDVDSPVLDPLIFTLSNVQVSDVLNLRRCEHEVSHHVSQCCGIHALYDELQILIKSLKKLRSPQLLQNTDGET